MAHNHRAINGRRPNPCVSSNPTFEPYLLTIIDAIPLPRMPLRLVQRVLVPSELHIHLLPLPINPLLPPCLHLLPPSHRPSTPSKPTHPRLSRPRILCPHGSLSQRTLQPTAQHLWISCVQRRASRFAPEVQTPLPGEATSWYIPSTRSADGAELIPRHADPWSAQFWCCSQRLSPL